MWDSGTQQLDRIEAELAIVKRLLLIIIRKENLIMAYEDDLEAKVARLTSVEESAVALIQGFGDRQQKALDDFKTANPGLDTARLQASLAAISADTDKLAAAVVANTPAAAAGAAAPAQAGS